MQVLAPKQLAPACAKNKIVFKWLLRDVLILLLYRCYGFKNFQHGISNLAKLTATEFKHILPGLYLIVDEVCADNTDNDLAKSTLRVRPVIAHVWPVQ